VSTMVAANASRTEDPGLNPSDKIIETSQGYAHKMFGALVERYKKQCKAFRIIC
jgi:hypothetical protein